MQMERNLFLRPSRCASIFLLTVIWLSCAAPPLAAQFKRKVTFGVPVTPPNVIHISPYVAKDMGFFTQQGIDVDIVTFEGGVGTLRG